VLPNWLRPGCCRRCRPLLGAGNAIAALGELLTSRRCQAAGCTVQRVDRAGVQDAADVLEGDADGEVDEVAFLGDPDQAAAALEELLVAGGAEAGSRAVQHVDRTGIRDDLILIRERSCPAATRPTSPRAGGSGLATSGEVELGCGP
jgi:alkanesulfonate monooxygenase SsuD/methylene tetrahydromethanopterin reductase-like flavin-dependent oxidoreductase (luciferase family)